MSLKNCHYILNKIMFFENNFKKYIEIIKDTPHGISNEPTLEIYCDNPRKKIDLLYYTNKLFNDIMKINS